MRRGHGARRGVALGALSLVYLLASCAPRVEGPAPVTSGEMVEAPISMTIQSGQTLSGIAHAYHVPMRVIADANGLSPPYRIQAGHTLIIPGSNRLRNPAPTVSVAALPPAGNELPLPATKLQVPTSPGNGQAEPVDHPVTTSPEGSPAVASPSLSPPPPTSGTAEAPAIKPSPAATAPVTVQPTTASPAGSQPATSAPSIRGGGAFLWPVRGNIVAIYGSRSDGSHNDGINIAAPKGAAVEATEAGTVAYTGNELRGYGNLILVKHPNGWISAYAHCDQMLVQRGQRVARGQVIARVGSTGNVSEPQLHFELRRGNHPVDPREFLAPLPTAITKDSHSG
jgi:murein DD-endopeptidase MepM/ murein hydrolase activator NlpD